MRSMAVQSKLSNSDRAEWEADGKQRSRCKTFGALKIALKRIIIIIVVFITFSKLLHNE